MSPRINFRLTNPIQERTTACKISYTLLSGIIGIIGFRNNNFIAGIILKRILDATGERMTYGPPLVNHVRASNAVENARVETEGKKWNEEFWRSFDQLFLAHLNSSTPSLPEAYAIAVRALRELPNGWARREADAMERWPGFFHG